MPVTVRAIGAPSPKDAKVTIVAFSDFQGKFKGGIDATTKEGTTVGVTGTPAVFINGRKISGAYPFDTFKKIAAQELAKKGSDKKKG